MQGVVAMGDIRLDGSIDVSHQKGRYRRIELITGEARRRRWTAEEKAAILAESCQPGASISEVARRHGMNRNLLGTWRRQARQRAAESGSAFVPVRVADESIAPLASSATPTHQSAVSRSAPRRVGGRAGSGSIDIEAGGVRVRIDGPADTAALRQVLAYLGERR